MGTKATKYGSQQTAPQEPPTELYEIQMVKNKKTLKKEKFLKIIISISKKEKCIVLPLDKLR